MISELGQRGFLCNAGLWSASRQAVQPRCAHGSPRASADGPGPARSVADRLFARPAGEHLRPCVASAPIRPDITDLMLPRHLAWVPKASVPDDAGRVLLVDALANWLGRGARFSGPSTAGQRWKRER